jgi:hypothetical protein
VKISDAAPGYVSKAAWRPGAAEHAAPLDPLAGIAAAVTRRTLDGAHPEGWVPEQKISVEEAVRAYTVGSAYAEYAALTDWTPRRRVQAARRRGRREC